MGHETELRQIECLNNRQIYRRLMQLIRGATHQIFLVRCGGIRSSLPSSMSSLASNAEPDR